MGNIFRFFFPKKEKIVEDEGVLGHYDSKQFHNHKYALIYAKEDCIFESEEFSIYTRAYKGTRFINILVEDERNLDITKCTYESLKPTLQEANIEPEEKSIVLVLFKEKNEATIQMAKKFCNSNKNHFEQALIYNSKKVQMDYYKPVPKFYKLYDHLCEDLYFDLSFIDPDRD